MTRYFEDLLRDSALGSAVKDGAMQECIGGASASQQPKFAERRQLNISAHLLSSLKCFVQFSCFGGSDLR